MAKNTEHKRQKQYCNIFKKDLKKESVASAVINRSRLQGRGGRTQKTERSEPVVYRAQLRDAAGLPLQPCSLTRLVDPAALFIPTSAFLLLPSKTPFWVSLGNETEKVLLNGVWGRLVSFSCSGPHPTFQSAALLTTLDPPISVQLEIPGTEFSEGEQAELERAGVEGGGGALLAPT